MLDSNAGKIICDFHVEPIILLNIKIYFLYKVLVS